MIVRGFPPILGPKPRVLILGTLPGEASLKARQYYANTRNVFWKILGSILGFDPALPYARRVAALERARIAVWDVCEAAHRPGSLDSAIARDSVRPNDFAALFAANPGIVAVLFNGTKAARLFGRQVVPTLTRCPELRTLPSTSRAHARMRFEEKRRRWEAALR